MNDGLDDIMEGLCVAGEPGPSRQQAARRTITRHGTEVFCGLITPGTSPIKTSGKQVRFLIVH